MNFLLAAHAELSKEQQQQTVAIYADDRNWGTIARQDLQERPLPSWETREEEILLWDALHRDSIFPQGQLVLLVKEQEKWKPIGSIQSVL
ncbi:hypothetical protein HZB00_03355, partial [Candidatus Woesearchaeota archaeon]|nr:hypothetical protein [Candidatus Woesearchaeota archaeon]